MKTWYNRINTCDTESLRLPQIKDVHQNLVFSDFLSNGIPSRAVKSNTWLNCEFSTVNRNRGCGFCSRRRATLIQSALDISDPGAYSKYPHYVLTYTEKFLQASEAQVVDFSDKAWLWLPKSRIFWCQFFRFCDQFFIQKMFFLKMFWSVCNVCAPCFGYVWRVKSPFWPPNALFKHFLQFSLP